MRFTNTLAAASAAAFAALASAGGALAADYTLTIASWAPPTHHINATQWPTFIKMVEDATDGRVTAEIKLGLAPAPAMMDLVLDGAADLSIIFHGYTPGRFVSTKLIELPGYEGSAEAASVAYQRVFEKHLAAADEHRGVKVLAVFTHGNAQLHSAEPITALSQMEGLKLRVPGGVGSDVGEALGAVGIQVPAPKVYETLASKAADGVVMPVEARKAFKLTEVAQNLYEMPGGFYRGSFAYIMNEETFADLPEDIRTALEEKVFGEPLARMLGASWDLADEEGWEETRAASDNVVNAATEADIAAFAPVKEKVRAGVMKEVEAAGIDAQAAYDMIVAEMAAETAKTN